jgi:hypothetical protein
MADGGPLPLAVLETIFYILATIDYLLFIKLLFIKDRDRDRQMGFGLAQSGPVATSSFLELHAQPLKPKKPAACPARSGHPWGPVVHCDKTI